LRLLSEEEPLIAWGCDNPNCRWSLFHLLQLVQEIMLRVMSSKYDLDKFIKPYPCKDFTLSKSLPVKSHSYNAPTIRSKLLQATPHNPTLWAFKHSTNQCWEGVKHRSHKSSTTLDFLYEQQLHSTLKDCTRQYSLCPKLLKCFNKSLCPKLDDLSPN
jgi:hypothetical protein